MQGRGRESEAQGIRDETGRCRFGAVRVSVKESKHCCNQCAEPNRSSYCQCDEKPQRNDRRRNDWLNQWNIKAGTGCGETCEHRCEKSQWQDPDGATTYE